MNVGDLCEFLDRYAPPCLAEDWDNVGLLVGDRTRQLQRVMTCLTITPGTAAEAIERRADLIISHHPLPFRPVRSITTDTPAGRMLWDLMGHRIAIYSPHTAFDSAPQGINARLAEKLELQNIQPLLPAADERIAGGTARIGLCAGPTLLAELTNRVKQRLNLASCRVVGAPDQPVSKIVVACGSGGTLLEPATDAGCDAFITGEASFHTCLEAEARSVGMLLIGHYASERFALDHLAIELAGAYPSLQIWASEAERDPIATW